MASVEPSVRYPVEFHTRAGGGKPGYCKICDSPFTFQIDHLLNKGQNAAQILRALEPFDFRFDRATLRKHKAHSSDPMTTFVKQAEKVGAIRQVSSQEYLQAVQEAAAVNVSTRPETVTVDQGINAAKVLLQDRNQRDSLKIVLMKTMTGRRDELIEADWTEVKELTTDDSAADD